MDKIFCACGCGKELNKFDIRGRARIYFWGHNNRGKSWIKKNIVKERHSHKRATKICLKDKCFAQNEQCSKRLEIAHIDGNPLNNEKQNLICLCVSHHRLYDFGEIPLDKLKEIRPFIISSGKRRYKKSKVIKK